MSVAASANYDQYADSQINYIPQLFAPAVLVKYYAASVVPAISNTTYEGVIKDKGDKVTIRTRPTITIRPYTKGQTLQKEQPSSAPVVLNIDQADYYDFVVDDVDDKQADIVLDAEFTEDAAQQMKIYIDTAILAAVYADADSKNAGATAGKISGNLDLGASGAPLAVTAQNVIEVLTMLSLVWDEENVPQTGRNTVIPAWFRYLIMNSDLKNASITGDGKSIVRNGRIGEVDMQTLYMSNLLDRVLDSGGQTATHVIACQKDALTFAAQLVKNESLRCPTTFGWEYRGLHVYGYKTVKAEGMIDLYCYKG